MVAVLSRRMGAECLRASSRVQAVRAEPRMRRLCASAVRVEAVRVEAVRVEAVRVVSRMGAESLSTSANRVTEHK
jgi:hypothetical protein